MKTYTTKDFAFGAIDDLIDDGQLVNCKAGNDLPLAGVTDKNTFVVLKNGHCVVVDTITF